MAVSIEDLGFAREWLLAYEVETEDKGSVPLENLTDLALADVPPEAARLLRVAAWIQAEISRREDASLDRYVRARLSAAGKAVSPDNIRKLRDAVLAARGGAA